MSKPKDYGETGFDIQYAMVDQVQRYPRKENRPDFVLWNGIHVKTSDALKVPNRGVVTATFLTAHTPVKQGFDLKLDGWLELAGGERVSLLRTWKDDIHEDSVRYPFQSNDGLLRFWNVYERSWPNGVVTEEKWTGNAGFWIETIDDCHRIYHCSCGPVERPDFSCLLVELVVESRRV